MLTFKLYEKKSILEKYITEFKKEEINIINNTEEIKKLNKYSCEKNLNIVLIYEKFINRIDTLFLSEIQIFVNGVVISGDYFNLDEENNKIELYNY